MFSYLHQHLLYMRQKKNTLTLALILLYQKREFKSELWASALADQKQLKKLLEFCWKNFSVLNVTCRKRLASLDLPFNAFNGRSTRRERTVCPQVYMYLQHNLVHTIAIFVLSSRCAYLIAYKLLTLYTQWRNLKSKESPTGTNVCV